MPDLRPSGWSLRTRLVAGLIGLLALLGGVVGAVTGVVLRDFLLQRLDSQLVAAKARSVQGAGQPPGDGYPGHGHGGPDGPGQVPGFLLGNGQAAGTVGVLISRGSDSHSGVVGDDGRLSTLPASARAALGAVPPDGSPHTVDVAGMGRYRVLAATTGDDVVVTGLPLAGVRETLVKLVVVEIAVTAAGLVIAGVAGTAVVRLSLRPLRRVAATAGRVSELTLDRGEVALAERVPAADTDARTEVGQVGAALNRLLGHVGSALQARQDSEMKVRRFVADASHELRTPLASIRGYAELTRRGGEDVPPDVAHALRRVESEAVRMTSLVEDLLLLARLDDAGAGVSRDDLVREDVDLSALVVDAVGDAHAAGPDHSWQLDLPAEPVLVVGDRSRLHQVVANLLANARTHTPPGTAVTAGLARQPDGAAVLTVCDEGPGIPAELLPSVFERFVRGDSSRSRQAGSTGLGLSIVQAVVAAHGGSVAVTSGPGRTAFLVRLPCGSTAQALQSVGYRR